MTNDEYTITISELSRLTGLPASTIRYYLSEGLITPPLKKGKTRAYYNRDHVKQLKKLKKLRIDNQLSISELKKNHTTNDTTLNEIPFESSLVNDRKDDIVSAAIELFRSKGYDGTVINDIAEKAGISKGTFYKHFSNKEDLFDECAVKIFYDIDNEFRELLDEKDIHRRLILRGTLFIKTHKHMIDMLNIARGSSISDPTQNAEKLKKIMENLTIPIAQDLQEGIKQGVFRQMDTIVVSHLLMGAVEYFIYHCNGKTEKEIEQMLNTIIVFIFEGLNPRLFDHV